MHGLALILVGVVGLAGEAEYARSLDAKALDQPAFDAESYGEKDAMKREEDGLHVVLKPRLKETGWRTPQQIRLGGDFTIIADLVVKKLPKPAQEDGAAVGMAIAFQDINQPDLTLVRLREPKGTDVYRPIEKETNNPMQQQMLMQQQMQMQMMGMAVPGKPPKPPRRTFPASGDAVRLEFRRRGNNIQYEVLDAKSGRSRYLGQAQFMQAMDVAAVKLFATNQNGVEPVDVVLKGLSIRADRVNGLGTIVRTVFDRVIYGDPTSIEKNMLIIGGQPRAPAGAQPNQPGVGAAAGPQPVGPTPAPAPPATPPAGAVAVAAPAPAVAVVVAPGAVRVRRAGRPAQVVPANPNQPPSPAPGDAGPKPPADPKKLPLDELDSIHFERTPGMTVRFIGQTNLDFTLPGRSYKKEEPKADGAKKPGDQRSDEGKKGELQKKEEKRSEASEVEASKKAVEKKSEEKKGEPAKKAGEKQGEPPKTAEDKKGDEKKDEPTTKDEKKPEEPDDVNAPLPGTSAPTKIPRVHPRKNGIRDLQITLYNLRPSKITQVMVNGQTDKGQASYRLDTTDSEDWPIAVRRSGTDSTADLFLEPPQGDCFQKDFTINVTYDDNQNANAQAKIPFHTKSDQAVSPDIPAVPPLHARVYLAGEDIINGSFEGIAGDKLQMTTPWQDRLGIPLKRVAGIHLAPIDRKESPESFARRLKSRGSEDVLLARTKAGEVVAIPGVVEGTDGDRLQFGYQGRTRTLPLSQVEGVILASRPESEPDDVVRARFQLADGVAVTGRWEDLDANTWKVQAPWGQEMKLPAAEVTDVRFRGGRMTYLSDLEPSKVEEVPYFGRKFPWRRDVNLLGEPLKMDGRAYARGLAVHSRCVLTYDLNARYATFEALVGFDESARGKGRVDCRVLADEKEIYANPDLRASDPPAKLSLDVAGAQQLRLMVEFGRGQDTGDRVIWADARLYRPAPPRPAEAKEPVDIPKPTTEIPSSKP